MAASWGMAARAAPGAPRRRRPQTRSAATLVALAAAAKLPGLARALYLPGIHPNEYADGDVVDMKVNKLTSVKTQLPYGYYTLPYCMPDEIMESVENLGEILTGDLIENSPYEIRMLKNETCKVLCKVSLDDDERMDFEGMIDDEYVVNWIIDGLPAATRYVPKGMKTITYSNGFPVGISRGSSYYLHNHVTLDIMYHAQPNEYSGYRIVGFEVEPKSVTQVARTDASDPSGMVALCSGPGVLPVFDLNDHPEVIFTYDVRWLETSVRWASRWDTYLKMKGGEVHWFSILNSLLVIAFLSSMVAMILMRTLHRDIAKYNDVALAEDGVEETGWKLVHGDIFRRPRFSKLLAVSVGSGMQILLMSIVTLFFALLGLLSPAHRGALLQSMMLLYTFLGVLAGYVSSRLYKTFNGEDWKTMTVYTAFLYPGVFFSIFFVLNLLIWEEKSSGAVPFSTMFAVLVLWFGISVPLVYLGAYVGLRMEPIELPVRTNQIPRSIPTQPWYVHPLFTTATSGMLPFGAIFTELFFIMSSIWQHQFYYLFGFLALVLTILILTCAEIAIAMTYFQLTAEDYHWWWRSFFASGSSALYVFIYTIHYFFTRLHIVKFVSASLYFGYMLLMSIAFFLLTGSIGTVSTFYFVRKIYGSIKVD